MDRERVQDSAGLAELPMRLPFRLPVHSNFLHCGCSCCLSWMHFGHQDAFEAPPAHFPSRPVVYEESLQALVILCDGIS